LLDMGIDEIKEHYTKFNEEESKYEK